MNKRKRKTLFDIIAPCYGLFYKKQRENFIKVIRRAENDLDISSYETILDVGCGPGALCSVLNEKGLRVTGIDSAAKMLNIAKKRAENTGVQFLHASILEPLPFPDKSFDISVASYVAHGLKKEERQRMYKQMNKVTKHKVIIHDFNANRGWLISFVEWLEQGDYFKFIQVAEEEMRNCTSDLEECFSSVQVIDVGTRASWYICTPK